MEILVDEFFQNQVGGATRGLKGYVSVYNNLAKQKPLKSDNKDKVIKALNNVLTRAESGCKIKDPEYFFKFLALLDERGSKAILEKLTSDKFDKPALEAGREWVNYIIENSVNEDIKQKLFGILEEFGIEYDTSLDFSSSNAQALAVGGTVAESLESVSVDFGSNTQEQIPFVTYASTVLDAPKTTEYNVNEGIPPQHGNARLVGVTIENLDNGVIEDHLYFNSNGEQLPKEKAPGEETVERIKSISGACHASGTLENSFLQEEPRKIIVDSMKRTGANTSAFVTASPSNNSKNPNQRVVDCVTFGEPSIRVRLDVVYDDGTDGVLYYYPYERRLTILDGDKKEHEASQEDFPNIVISEPVHYNSLSNDFAQTKSAEVETNESSTVTFDGGIKKPVVGPHTKTAVDFGAQPGNSVDFGAVSK